MVRKKRNKSNSFEGDCLDLHGHPLEGLENLVDRFLREAKGHQALIMTGKGTGKVQKAVIKYLEQAHYPWRHQILVNGLKNEGVLVVDLD